MILNESIDVESQIQALIDTGWYEDALNCADVTLQHGIISQAAYDGFLKALIGISFERQRHYMNEFLSRIRDTPQQRYLNLLKERPHIVRRIPQHYIASYLGITSVHLSRIKNKLAQKR